MTAQTFSRNHKRLVRLNRLQNHEVIENQQCHSSSRESNLFNDVFGYWDNDVVNDPSHEHEKSSGCLPLSLLKNIPISQ